MPDMSSLHALTPDVIETGRAASFWSVIGAAIAALAVLSLPRDEPVGDEWLDIELGTLLFY